MRVDEERTREARRRHKLGVIRLSMALAEGTRGSIFWQFRNRGGGGNTQAVRMRPGCPPVRDAEHQEKHRKRKAAKASRRRNRR